MNRRPSTWESETLWKTSIVFSYAKHSVLKSAPTLRGRDPFNIDITIHRQTLTRIEDEMVP
jgi:hypothetical protein